MLSHGSRFNRANPPSASLSKLFRHSKPRPRQKWHLPEAPEGPRRGLMFIAPGPKQRASPSGAQSFAILGYRDISPLWGYPDLPACAYYKHYPRWGEQSLVTVRKVFAFD